MTSVGVVLPPDLPVTDVRDFILEAEAFGFDELWVVEDCFLRGGIAQAALALGLTSRIHVGIGLLPAGARNAAFAAMEIATLANFYPGRLTVALGHGMPEWMRQVGAWPRSPLTLLSEQLRALRSLLAGERLDTREQLHVRLNGVQLAAPPPEMPSIFAGVRGPRSLSMAAQEADGVLLAEPATPEYLQRVSALANETRKPVRIIAYNVGAVDDDEGRALALARLGLTRVGDEDWRPHLTDLPFADDLLRLRSETASRDEFAHALPDSWVRRLAVVGTPGQARLRLEALRDAGAERNILSPLRGRAGLAGLAKIL